MNEHDTMKGTRMQSDLSFRLMSLEFRLRDRLLPPERVLSDTGCGPGMTIVDFGCGPGGFTVAAARLVGTRGMVYAVDVHPLALRAVKRASARQGLRHIRAMHGNDLARIPDGCADIVLMYDVLHHIPEPAAVLDEFRRVLKPGGLLSVTDHHLKEASILAAIAPDARFRFDGREHHSFRFKPVMTGGAK